MMVRESRDVGSEILEPIAKREVTIIGEVHCNRSCHTNEAKIISALRPDFVLLEMLPGDQKYEDCCRRLTRQEIDVIEFFERTEFEQHWGPSAPYRPLFDVLRKHSTNFGPLDHLIADRQKLTQMERDLILDYKKKETIDESLLREERLLLFQLRDLAFVRNIVRVLLSGATNVVAIMGGNHVENMVRYVGMLGYIGVEKIDLAPLYRALEQEERKFSKREKQQLLSANSPPLVLINALLFNEVFQDIRKKSEDKT